MTDTPTKPGKKPARLQHVVAEETGHPNGPVYRDIVVFGQELDALRHIVGKQDWVYVAVAHGQSVAEALKAARS